MTLRDSTVTVLRLLKGRSIRDCDIPLEHRNDLEIAINHDPPLVENGLPKRDDRVGYNGILAVAANSPEAFERIAEHNARMMRTFFGCGRVLADTNWR